MRSSPNHNFLYRTILNGIISEEPPLQVAAREDPEPVPEEPEPEPEPEPESEPEPVPEEPEPIPEDPELVPEEPVPIPEELSAEGDSEQWIIS
ncbi:hypothetical protein CBS147332_1917 [Penicillium roqueforti]|nr:hypothetical protein CBS147332_1917 [Penicillium roqueforti]KAI3107251.1 hypothetical protein CBS147331_6557 [Penicillium roqueforti]